MNLRTTTTVVLRAKDEAPYLPEWVARHKSLGFDQIVVITHDLADDSGIFLEALSTQHQIHWIDVSEELAALPPNAQKNKVVNDAALAAVRGIARSDWFYVADADEFLLLNGHEDVGSWLAGFAHFDQVMVGWVNLTPTRSNVRLSERPPTVIGEWHEKPAAVLKSFTRPDSVEDAGPHRLLPSEALERVALADGKPLNASTIEKIVQQRATRQGPGGGHILFEDPCWLEASLTAVQFHFKYRSVEEYIFSKIERGSLSETFLRNSMPDYIARIRSGFQNPTVDTTSLFAERLDAAVSELLKPPQVREAHDKMMSAYRQRISTISRGHYALKLFEAAEVVEDFDIEASARQILDEASEAERDDALLQLAAACRESGNTQGVLDALLERGARRGQLKGGEVEQLIRCLNHQSVMVGASPERDKLLARIRQSRRRNGNKFLGSKDVEFIIATIGSANFAVANPLANEVDTPDRSGERTQRGNLYPRPRLTFPEETAEVVRRHYENADVILEYGSGGSTVVAAEMSGKSVYTVESDAGWLCRLNMYLQNASPPSMPYLLWSDVGPTKDWGYPIGTEHYHKFPAYADQPWSLLEAHGRDPDVVLIDGRFRAACFLATIIRLRKPAVVLFDDYRPRPYKKIVEKFAQPSSYAGKLAVFNVTPQTIDARVLLGNMEALLDPK